MKKFYLITSFCPLLSLRLLWLDKTHRDMDFCGKNFSLFKAKVHSP